MSQESVQVLDSACVWESGPRQCNREEELDSATDGCAQVKGNYMAFGARET